MDRLRNINDQANNPFDIFESHAQISLADVIHLKDISIWNAVVISANAQELNQKKLRLTYMYQKIKNCCTDKVLNKLQKKQRLYLKPNGEADGIVFLKVIFEKYSTKTA